MLIQSLFCALNFMLSARRRNFTTLSATHKSLRRCGVRQAIIRLSSVLSVWHFGLSHHMAGIPLLGAKVFNYGWLNSTTVLQSVQVTQLKQSCYVNNKCDRHVIMHKTKIMHVPLIFKTSALVI